MTNPPRGGLVLSVLQRLLRLLPEAPETLRGTLGAWYKKGFGPLLEDQPALSAALSRVTYVEEAEAVMYTFGQYVADKTKESEASGR